MIDVPEPVLGGWIQTATGRRVYPLHPRVEDIYLEDIAHSLANQCRFAGHVPRFYSVAQHSILVSSLVPPPYTLWGLLHDAAEAYFCDLPSPLKHSDWAAPYCEAEDAMLQVIAQRFELSWPEPEMVREADAIALALEGRDLLGNPEWIQNLRVRLPQRTHHITPWGPAMAKRAFLKAVDNAVLEQYDHPTT